VLGRIRGLVTPRHRIAWGTKGFAPDDRKLLHQVAREQLGPDVPLATVSGPTFAREVARGLPCALVIASDDAPFARDVAKALQTDYLLPFTSRDLIGVQVGGAVKNVIAIAAGIADGLGFGSNARAALITRGLHEITRLGQALGAARETFVGLSGLGDLVLTCSDDQSRNRRFGLALGRGASVAQAHAEVGQVVEGMTATAAVHHLAREQGLELPICGQVHQVVRRGRAPSDAVRELLSRPPASERA
jgi:glycerol-3-phosphate dehydrogenase (NAD(P)+)